MSNLPSIYPWESLGTWGNVVTVIVLNKPVTLNHLSRRNLHSCKPYSCKPLITQNDLFCYIISASTVTFRQCILTTHNHWKWSIQLWIQNCEDECYECTLCIFWQNMHECKRKYFNLNSIDIHKYSGSLVIRIPGWSSQFSDQLQSSPLTLVIWDNLVMVPITRGEPERNCTLIGVAWVKHEQAASLCLSPLW